jgi:PadR family transcriptional regulator, regulatory protein PadR
MGWPFRVTGPLVEVVRALLDAEGPVHGWHLAEVTDQSGPNVYRALRRLHDAAWVEYQWVDSPEPGRPRRRLYWLTPAGQLAALKLLHERSTTTPDTHFGRQP